LKKLIQKVQDPTANPSQISSSPTSRPLQSLPFVDTYAVNNRLAPPMPPQFGIPPSQHSGSMLPSAAYNYSGYPPGQQWNSGSHQQASGYWQQPSSNPAAMRNQQPFEQFARGPYKQQRTYPRYDRSQVTCFNCGGVGHWRTECPHLGYPNSDTTNSQFRNEFPPNLPQGTVNSQLRSEQPPTIPIPGINRREGGIPNSAQDHGGQQRIVGTVASIEIKKLSSALTGMSVNTLGEGNTDTLKEEFVEEIVPGMPSSYTDTKYVGEAMGGERARRHSEVQETSGTPVEPLSQRRRFNYQQPGQDSPQRMVAKQKGKRPPIRLMVDQNRFDFVAGFRDTLVTGLSWGQFFDLAPEAKRQFVRLMVQERAKRNKEHGLKGKGEAKARVVEAALVEALLVGKYEDLSSVVNFYTTARARLNGRVFELKHVLVDGGSVVNLAPISVLRAMQATLFRTQELTIRTATSSLVEIEFYADLDIEVASVVVHLRVYSIPAVCEPTFGLLLSRRWLRQVQAIGDYANHTYVIKDQLGKEVNVPCEMGVGSKQGIRPRIALNLEARNVHLETEELEELQLEGELSFEEVVEQVTREANDDLAAYDYSDEEYDRYNTESEVEVDDSYGKGITSEDYGGDESSNEETVNGRQEN